MLRIRKATERGHADHGWLNTCHTFSCAGCYDPKQTGFGDILQGARLHNPNCENGDATPLFVSGIGVDLKAGFSLTQAFPDTAECILRG